RGRKHELLPVSKMRASPRDFLARRWGAVRGRVGGTLSGRTADRARATRGGRPGQPAGRKPPASSDNRGVRRDRLAGDAAGGTGTVSCSAPLGSPTLSSALRAAPRSPLFRSAAFLLACHVRVCGAQRWVR